MSTEPSQQLTAVEPGPPMVPAVFFQGTAVQPAAYDWVIDDKPVSFRAAPDPAHVALPIIPVDNELTVTISSAIAPAELIVSVFTELDAERVPTDHVGNEIDCLTSKQCARTVADGETLIHVTGLAEARIVVLHLGYVTTPPSDTTDGSRIMMLTASWGIRTRI